MTDRNTAPALDVRGLNVFYGASHALQGVDLTLPGGVLSVVGRNGMGKTTLCKTIMGLIPARSGSINFGGKPLLGRDPGSIARMGVAYVPQGRRLWPSLTVDEHLKMLGSAKGSWTPERVYDVFPRLAERKQNGGGQLSGGEQQMLAIGRGLMARPRLLLLDEPSLGLAPIIIADIFKTLNLINQEHSTTMLLVEQNANIALKHASFGYVLQVGKVAIEDTASNLRTNKEVIEAYMGAQS